jgi:beta-glucosidase
LTRVDQNVDFSWSSGNPGITNNDNYTAQWDGYFVAPESGDYYFGAVVDDFMEVRVNGVTVVSHTCCATNPGWATTPVGDAAD